LALRRFGETVRPLLPATLASDVPGLFSKTFEHGTGAGSPGLVARVSAAVRELPPSPGFGRGLPVFGLDALASEEGRIRTSSFPLAAQDPAQGIVELEVATAEETADTPMPVREVRAWLRRDGETVGFAQATLYLPRGRGGVSLDDATEIADIVSDADVWAVRNLGRSEGRDVFRSGVAMLWPGRMAPRAGNPARSSVTPCSHPSKAPCGRRCAVLRTLDCCCAQRSEVVQAGAEKRPPAEPRNAMQFNCNVAFRSVSGPTWSFAAAEFDPSQIFRRGGRMVNAGRKRTVRCGERAWEKRTHAGC